jgi:hypothetical protein
MVDLRGGIKQLSKEMPEIAQKIFRCVVLALVLSKHYVR